MYNTQPVGKNFVQVCTTTPCWLRGSENVVRACKEIISENRDFKGRGCGPGGIQFLYGETSKHYSSELAFTPETGTMFVFPATLRHYVAPFKSKVIRTSVSGNLYGQL